MASTVYDVLEKIERGRKHCIKNAKIARLPANENMDFYSLGDLFLQQNNPSFIVERPWDRPIDWPDTTKILREAEDRDNLVPGYICMVDNSSPCIYFDEVPSNAGILTSDGSWYAIKPERHTWDITKDINCANEGYKVRWFIVYLPANTSTQIRYLNTPLIEVIVGRVTLPTWSVNFGSDSYSNAGNLALINFEVLSEVNFTSPSQAFQSKCFMNCVSLRHIKIPKITAFSHSSSETTFGHNQNLEVVELPDLTDPGGNYGCFYACPKLRYVDMPKLRTVRSGMFAYCSSLKNIYLPEALQIDRGAFAFSGLESLIAPKVTTLSNTGNSSSGATFESCPLKELNLPVLETIRGNHFYKSSIEEFNLPKLKTIDSNSSSTYLFSNMPIKSLRISSLITTIPYPASLFVNCMALVDLSLPGNWNFSGLNLSTCKNLSHESLIQIINSLKDNSESGSPKTLVLGSNNLSKLTQEEIAIGTSKGWTIS